MGLQVQRDDAQALMARIDAMFSQSQHMADPMQHPPVSGGMHQPQSEAPPSAPNESIIPPITPAVFGGNLIEFPATPSAALPEASAPLAVMSLDEIMQSIQQTMGLLDALPDNGEPLPAQDIIGNGPQADALPLRDRTPLSVQPVPCVLPDVQQVPNTAPTEVLPSAPLPPEPPSLADSWREAAWQSGPVMTGQQLQALSRKHLLMLIRDLMTELAQAVEDRTAMRLAYQAGAAQTTPPHKDY